MSAATLDEAKRLADRLTPLDQARLVEHLASRIAQAVASTPEPVPAGSEAAAEAGANFFRPGEALERGDSPDAPTLTSAVLSMRR